MSDVYVCMHKHARLAIGGSGRGSVIALFPVFDCLQYAQTEGESSEHIPSE